MIIITGASRGIGRYLFTEFIKENQDVIGTYNTSFPPEEHSGFFYKLDISDNHSITNMVEGIREKLTNIILVNNAGITYNAFAHKSEISPWEEVINVNLIGTYKMIRALLPLMREQQFGRIINISSVLAQFGSIGTSAYAASKSGLWGLTKAVAKENANKNITINNLNLGYMNTGLIQEVPEEIKRNILGNIPIGKFGDVSEIFNAIKFLIEANYITGASIDINGGLY